MKAIPLWLAVAITVVVSLPFGLWLQNYNIPLWTAFIVWAEYFALGAKPEALKIIVPAYVLGVIGAMLVLILMQLVTKYFTVQLLQPGDLGVAIAFFIGFCLLIYAMKWFPVTQVGTLPFFNGISMGLATFFCGAYFAWGGIVFEGDFSIYILPVITSIPAILAGLLGAFLGWFNVVIMQPFRSE
jgi:hypothetical protein